MGGLFKAKTPSSPQVSQPTTSTTTAAVDAAAAERERRKEALERARTGRAGTITTSERGLLTPVDWLPERKSLLGE